MIGPDFFDHLEREMALQSNDRLAEIVREGIAVTLPHDHGTATRIPLERQVQEAYVAARELERRAGGTPEPIPHAPDWDDIPEYRIAVELDRKPPAPIAKRPARKAEIVRAAEEKLPTPEWWDKPAAVSVADRHALADITEVEVVELPDDLSLEELESLILKGMPSRMGDHWHIPIPQELSEAHAALKMLLEKANEHDRD